MPLPSPDKPLQQTSAEDNWLVYDGDCPFCSAYVHMLRLREAIGAVRLIDAREGGPEVARVIEKGMDLDSGMVLCHEGKLYHGADCVHRIALLTTPNRAFNRLNAWVFRHEWLSRLLYPVLRFGRACALRLLGRKPFSESGGLRPADKDTGTIRPRS